MVLSTTRPNGLSSTLRMCSAWDSWRDGPPASPAFAAPRGPAGASATVSAKMVPPPGRCAAVTSPPMARASCRTEDSPSPAPPKREAMETLACENGRNSRLISGRDKPMPLSEIAKLTIVFPVLSLAAFSFGRRVALTSRATPPCSVNFTALSIRFSSAARSLMRSPKTSAGTLSAMWTSQDSPLAAARPARESPAARASARRSNRSSRMTAWARSGLAASTNTVASAERCSAPALMVSTQRRSRSPRSDVASRSLIAMMPVSGVRTSWAKAASAASTTFEEAVCLGRGLGLDRRLRLGSSVGPDLTFCSDLARCWRAETGESCFTDRFFLRFTRDLAAMIPRSPCLGNNGMAEPKKSRTRLRRCCHVSGQWRGRDADTAANVIRRGACGAQLAQAGRPGGFRQLMPGIIHKQPMVPIHRLAQAEQLLEQDMHAGCMEQVRAPDHLADALQSVIDHDGEVVAGWGFLARQDDVAPGLRVRDNRAAFAGWTLPLFAPGELA